jgi:hypothetical protein
MNFIKKYYLIILILLLSFLDRVVFSALVPIWHTPDEQAHFAQIAYFGELNKMPKSPPDLNNEIYISEELLGTLRDEKGNNKFTFNPTYKIEYTNYLEGKYESQIKNIPLGERKNLIKQEAASYPPLYYYIGGLVYKAFYNTDLITRIFLVRGISLTLGVLTVYVSWLIAKELFPKNKILEYTLPVLVSFQPMFVFVSSGVNSDNLLNLLFALVLYLSLKIIKQGISSRYLLEALGLVILLYLTKPQFMLSLPTFLLAIVMSILINNKISSQKKIFLLILSLLAVTVLSLVLLNEAIFSNTLGLLYSQTYFPMVPNRYTELSFIQHLRNTVIHTVREVIPWYWGVFDWLGVTYPREVHRIINRLMIVAGVGLLVKFYLIFRKKTMEDYLFIFLVLSALVYFAGITVYNYLVNITIGFPFGLQGRYYFPTIIPHMVIILVGLITLVPIRFKDLGTKILGLLMVIFNFIAIYTIANTYYDLSDFNNFVIQASQYKIWFYKGGWLVTTMMIYLIVMLIFVFNYFKLANKSSD